MRIWIRGWACVFILFASGCSSCGDDCSESCCAGQAVDEFMVAEGRLESLEGSMSAVGAKRAWSGKYFRGGTVRGVALQGSDLFAEVFNSESRRFEAHCVNVKDGTVRWMVDLGPAPLKHAPMAGDRFVVFLLDQGGGMAVVNRMNGARDYRMATPIKVLPMGPAGSSDTTVYVGSLVDQRLHALSPDSGMTGWHFKTEGTINAGPLVTPRHPRRLVVVGTDQGEVVALPATSWSDLRPEQPAWTRKLLGDVSGEIAVAEATTPAGVQVSVLVPCEDNGLYCLDAATGEPRWVARSTAPFHGRPASAGGKVFARNADKLVVTDLLTGAPAWASSEAGSLPNPWEMCDTALAGDASRIYLLQGASRVHRVDAKTGQVLATGSLDMFDELVATGDNNVLLGVTRDGHMVAFN